MRKKKDRRLARLRKLTVLGLLLLTLVPGIPATDSDAADTIPEPAEDTIAVHPNEEIIPEKLTHPSSFQAEAVKNGMKLTWKEVDNAQSYEIYRKEADAKKYTLIKTTEKCTYIDKRAEYGVTYAYKIRAIAVFDSKTLKSKCSTKKSCRTYYIDPAKPMVALTFDDGPSQYTEGILDVLEKYDSRATFFEVGNRVHWYPDTVLRIDRMGCELGNHSYDHPVMGNASASKIRSEIGTTDKKMKAITGKEPVLFRPPYGSIGTNLKKYAGKPLILWSIDTLDWQSRNADKVYRSVMNNVKDGDIILMHDIFRSTRSATERIVPELKKRGYQLVTISELAQYRTVELVSGRRYSQIRPQTD